MMTKSRTEQILIVMHILAWVVCIGLMIEAGAILVSFGVSCVNPEAAKNLYQGLDLYALRRFSFWYYAQAASFMFALAGMKAYVVFLVIRTLAEVKLLNPFKVEVALMLEKISYVLLGIWLVALVSSAHADWLLKTTGEVYPIGASGEFLFAAGLVFIISQIFKRGVELQSENELTV
ncbi:MAG: DUF2975 domain-containing protein [Saprospiraceae bacterium]|jgi:hypothetical protein|nr:DUF2975 domain-containing protein [Lewinellaceae bacterium]